MAKDYRKDTDTRDRLDKFLQDISSIKTLNKTILKDIEILKKDDTKYLIDITELKGNIDKILEELKRLEEKLKMSDKKIDIVKKYTDKELKKCKISEEIKIKEIDTKIYNIKEATKQERKALEEKKEKGTNFLFKLITGVSTIITLLVLLYVTFIEKIVERFLNG